MVCKEEDDFVFEKPQWIAYLSNGEKVIQDDNRPGVEPPQAWIRLGNYCRQNRVHVVRLILRFRSHFEETTPDNALGYYFINKVAVVQGEQNMYFYVVGYLDEDRKIHTKTWKIPELIVIDEDIRNAIGAGPSLIRRDNESA